MVTKLIRVSKDVVEKLTFDEVLKKYKGLIVKLIKKWSFKYEYDDLYQMACLGLWDAYKFHNSNCGYCFGTLAEKTVINYISWYRQNNNLDKIKRDTSNITDICSYDSHDGYKETFIDKEDHYNQIELKIILDEVLNKLKKQNEFLRAHEKKASQRNLEFLKLTSLGVTQREIAESYDINVTTVQRGLYKEYKRIKKFLKAETYEEISKVI